MLSINKWQNACFDLHLKKAILEANLSGVLLQPLVVRLDQTKMQLLPNVNSSGFSSFPANLTIDKFILNVINCL